MAMALIATLIASAGLASALHGGAIQAGEPAAEAFLPVLAAGASLAAAGVAALDA